MVNLRKLAENLFLFILLIPNTIWIFLDKSLWWQDAPSFGRNAITLYNALISDPKLWVGLMWGMYHAKPPLWIWLGQFFVPIGKIIGSIDSGLLLLNIFLNFLVLVIMFNVFEGLFKNKLISYTGCLIIAAAPLFYTFSILFIYEPLILLGSSWVLFIMVNKNKWDNYFIFLQLVILFCFMLLSRVNALLYVVIPMMSIIYSIFRDGGFRINFKKHKLLTLFSSALLLFTFSWYKTFMYDLFISAKNSSICMLYAVPGDYFERLYLIFKWSIDVFFLKYSYFLITFLMSCTILVMIIKRKYYSQARVCLILLFQIVFVWLVLAAFIHMDSRYLLALLPYFTTLICMALFVLQNKLISLFVIACFITQGVIVNLQVFGYMPCPMYSFQGPRSLVRVEPEELILAREIVDICKRVDAKVVAFATFKKCGGYQVRYYAEKENVIFKHIDVSLVFESLLKQGKLNGSQKENEDSIIKEVLRNRPQYFICFDPEICSRYGNNEWTRWEDIITDKLIKSLLFERVNILQYPKIRVYKYKYRSDV